jgi:hypothetical protein
VPDGSDVIVGRMDTGNYAAFPADGAELLRWLQAGVSTDEAERRYRGRYGEAVDMADFLATLRDLDFIRPQGEAVAGTVPPRQVRGLLLGRVAFSWPVWLVYLGLCGYALVLMVRFPYLRPRYQNFFFTPSLLLMELGLFFGQLPGIVFHEAMHVLAGRRLGVPTRVRLGNRLYTLVFETHLDGLWSVPRRQRYLPLLAGVLGDLVWCALLTVLAWLTDPHAGRYTFPGAFLRALALATLLRLAWQFYLYLRTDVYQVFVTGLRCVDLHQTTREYLTNRVRRALRRPARYDESRWHPRDRRIARWYVYLFVAGYAFTVGTFAWVGVPLAVGVFAGIGRRVLAGAAFSPRFLDGCLTFVLNFVPLMIVAVMVARRRRAHRKAA